MELEKYSLGQFTEVLSSSAPTPGGGGASAVCASIGASLGSMVCSLTIGKKKFKEFEPWLNDTIGQLETLRKTFLKLADDDAAAFGPLAEAYKIPKDDPSRDDIMEKALVSAAAVPLEIMRTCGKTIEIFAVLSGRSSALAISDVGVGVNLTASAMMSAALNVFINTKLMKDRNTAGKLNEEADMLMEKYLPMSDDVYADVVSKVR